jgi:hypothetical protein
MDKNTSLPSIPSMPVHDVHRRRGSFYPTRFA